MKTSSDIWFIAFLMLKNYTIIKYDVLGRGKVKCYFNITEESTWQELKLEFNNSQYVKFKTLVEQVKDLGY